MLLNFVVFCLGIFWIIKLSYLIFCSITHDICVVKASPHTSLN